MTTAKIGFAVLDGNPVRYRLGPLDLAWWFAQGQWRKLNAFEAGNEATVLSEKDFNERFPNLHALPPGAFN